MTTTNASFWQACRPGPHNSLAWAHLLLMLGGLILYGWQPQVMVFAYFFETIIIGLLHLIKMGLAARLGPEADPEVARSYHSTGRQVGYYLLPFFLVHYFFFVFVQSVFVFAIFGRSVPGVTLNEAFQVPSNYWKLLQLPDMQLIVLIIFTTQVAYLLRYFIAPKRYQTADVSVLMMQPYLRIVVQQFVAILSGFFILFSSQGMAAAILLILTHSAITIALLAVRETPEMLDSWIQKTAAKSEDADQQKKRLNTIIQAFLTP